jgi:hypothetical protein
LIRLFDLVKKPSKLFPIFHSRLGLDAAGNIHGKRPDFLNRPAHVVGRQSTCQDNRPEPARISCQRPIEGLAGSAGELRVVGVEQDGVRAEIA